MCIGRSTSFGRLLLNAHAKKMRSASARVIACTHTYVSRYSAAQGCARALHYDYYHDELVGCESPWVSTSLFLSLTIYYIPLGGYVHAVWLFTSLWFRLRSARSSGNYTFWSIVRVYMHDSSRAQCWLLSFHNDSRTLQNLLRTFTKREFIMQTLLMFWIKALHIIRNIA